MQAPHEAHHSMVSTGSGVKDTDYGLIVAATRDGFVDPLWAPDS